MALKTWQNIANTEIDRESPVTVVLVGKFHDNHEVLISGPVDARFDLVSAANASYTNVATREVFIEPAVATTDGDTDLVLRLEAYRTGGTDIDVRARINGGAWTAITGITSTSSTNRIDVVIPSANGVKAAAGSLATIDVEARGNGGATYNVSSLNGSSRIERND